MSRNPLLTHDQPPITGMFWLPGDEDNSFPGTLHLKAGKKAKLVTNRFNYGGLLNMFPGAKRPAKGETLKLEGEAFNKAQRLPFHPVLHGHDEHGHDITLIRASSGSSRSTLAMSSFNFSCQGVVFGSCFDPKATKFAGVRLRVDHLDEWVGRCAFQHHGETYTDHEGKKRLSQITIPVARDLAIPLGLPGYRSSRFFCAWAMSYGAQKFELNGEVFFDLLFEESLGWNEVLERVHRWEWFFSLATRDTLDLSCLELYPEGKESSAGEFPNESFSVWLQRRNSATPLHPKRTDHDFHFTFSDVESDFPSVIARWQHLQTTWEAVLHRFFATTAPRDLWMNEEFLFLAQAVESMHRGRNGGSKQNTDLNQAAKSAWEGAPAELQRFLGPKKDFINQFRKTRNYWTHYGEPSPRTDTDVLEGTDLIYFNEKLRFVVEAGLLADLGVPNRCVAKVWGLQWRIQLIDFS